MLFLITLYFMLLTDLKPSKQSVCKVPRTNSALQHLPLSSPLCSFSCWDSTAPLLQQTPATSPELRWDWDGHWPWNYPRVWWQWWEDNWENSIPSVAFITLSEMGYTVLWLHTGPHSKLFLSWISMQAGILIKMGTCLTGGAISQLCISRSSLVAWFISTGTTHGSSQVAKM